MAKIHRRNISFYSICVSASTPTSTADGSFGDCLLCEPNRERDVKNCHLVLLATCRKLSTVSLSQAQPSKSDATSLLLQKTKYGYASVRLLCVNIPVLPTNFAAINNLLQGSPLGSSRTYPSISCDCAIQTIPPSDSNLQSKPQPE